MVSWDRGLWDGLLLLEEEVGGWTGYAATFVSHMSRQLSARE